MVPSYRPDGLVARRPRVDYDDPLVENFEWVAMLDPVELASGVAVEAVVRRERAGREIWSATLTPGEWYQPRCPGCCELLWTAERWRATSEDEPPPDLPPGYRVSLDVATGVVVELVALEGSPVWDFSVEIREVAGWDDPHSPPPGRGT